MHTVRSPLRVLVVDDERVIAETFAAILIRAGYEAYAAYCAEDAVELAAQVAPDVVITDVVMGQMSGIDLALHLRREFPRCRVLLISGDVRTAELLEAMEGTGFDVPLVAKPVHPEEVLSFILKCQDGATNQTTGTVG